MLSPISQFGYQINGLEVSLTSLSLNTDADTQYLWDFGDGITSTLENPLHTFLQAGFYQVSLTVTNLDLQSTSSSNIINLSGTLQPVMFTDIPQLVDLYCPTEIIGTAKNNSQKEFLIDKWQEYLQPLVFNPSVSIENTHIANSYPPLVNYLIAKLVVIDIIIMESSAFLIQAATSGNNGGTTSSSGTTNSSTQGGIKSIETGPTKVERYENKDTSSTSEKLSNLSKAYQSLISPGGVLDQLRETACQEAKRLQIYLPTCGPLVNDNKGFKVVKNTKVITNPFNT